MLDDLRCVLPIAVQQHNDVEFAFDGPAIARLLIASVPKVDRVANHCKWQVRHFLIFKADLVGGVFARVIADQHMIHALTKCVR